MTLYGLKNCDTCRKALKMLEGARLVDVRAEGIEPSVMDAALAQFGAALVNTRSTTWRGLSEMERGRDPAVLLAEHPALMKRPLIRDDSGALHLGWTPATRTALGVG